MWTFGSGLRVGTLSKIQVQFAIRLGANAGYVWGTKALTEFGHKVQHEICLLGV